MLGIDLNETAAAVIGWGNQLGLSYPLLLDPASTVYSTYGLGYIPHNALLDTSMVVLYTFYGYDEQTLLSIISNYYPTPPSVQSVAVSQPFMRVAQDSLTITSQLENPENNTLSVKAIISILDSMVVDSIDLYDDGNHNDGQAGDMLYGGFLPPLSAENDYSVGIKFIDHTYSVQSFIPDGARFTTIGPMNLESYVEVMRLPDRIFYKISLINNSQTAMAKSISATVSTDDPNVTAVTGAYQTFGSIAAGQIVQCSQNIGFMFANMQPSFTVPIHLEISSQGFVFWEDSSEIVVGLEDHNSTLPMDFTLKQNYPNPFNPTTSITFELPQASEVTIKIYDMLGKEITTLVSQKLTVGSHTMSWDASDMPSGVYIYRMEAAKAEGKRFKQTRKMILMK
ncbi:MAG: T9SS type A sorting domain-containing protein [Calditrichia bacterium]|nr:T9SS type A sorting domain-containing protein [Calditrichia bacterium]